MSDPRRLIGVLCSTLPLAVTIMIVPVGSAGAPVIENIAGRICNRSCDGRDPALSPVDRRSTSSVVSSRRVVLHFDDTDAMAWASIDTGGPEDTV